MYVFAFRIIYLHDAYFNVERQRDSRELAKYREANISIIIIIS